MPPPTSTATTTRGAERGDAVVEEVHVAEGGGAEDHPLGAGAHASRTASIERSPPPYWTGTPVSEAIRPRWSSDSGSPERAPSRSTTCR